MTLPLIYILGCFLFVKKNIDSFELNAYARGYWAKKGLYNKSNHCHYQITMKSLEKRFVKYYNNLINELKQLNIKKLLKLQYGIHCWRRLTITITSSLILSFD